MSKKNNKVDRTIGMLFMNKGIGASVLMDKVVFYDLETEQVYPVMLSDNANTDINEYMQFMPKDWKKAGNEELIRLHNEYLESKNGI